MRVLIVDDHLTWRKALRLFFNSLPGIETIEDAPNGLAALAICQTSCPDIILMDIHMPGQNGFETAQAILAVQPQIKVVGISSDASEECQQQAMQSGFCSLLAKGNVLEELPLVLAQLDLAASVLYEGTIHSTALVLCESVKRVQ
jgi:DNA-binding NarL/FixJ family response regulator